jgi:hypothetical protein
VKSISPRMAASVISGDLVVDAGLARQFVETSCWIRVESMSNATRRRIRR